MKNKWKWFFLLILPLGIWFIYDNYYFQKYVTLFSVEYPTENKKTVSNKLKDKMNIYMKWTKKKGIKKEKNKEELFANNELHPVSSSKNFNIAKLHHSYPLLTHDGLALLEKIGEKFNEKLKNTNLEGSKFIVTSLTRTESSLSQLKEVNQNASQNSAHLYGECFDISYSTFILPFTKLESCHKNYLRETLAEVILELRNDKLCWALKEFKQPCFHIVCK
jgi:hypothetical protein